MFVTPGLVNAAVRTGIDEQATLPYWELTQAGMSLRLVQRLPDQTRGYFLARGFTQYHSEIIAQSCVFQTIIKNTLNADKSDVLQYNLSNWKVIHAGEQKSMKVREQWEQQWLKEGISKSSRIAFEWSLLPTRQQYQPGDYNWGMSIFNIKPGERFNLEVVWKLGDKRQTSMVKDIECAPDIHPDPESGSL